MGGGSKIQELRTTPYDPRFPNTNQTKHCQRGFIDFQKCAKQKGEDSEECQKFRMVYKSLCPNEWIEKWETAIEEGCFPVKI